MRPYSLIHLQGRVFVGDDFEAESYSVGSELPSLPGGLGNDYLFVKDEVSFSNGRVYYGNAVFGRNNVNLPQGVTVDGTVTDNMPNRFDFAGAETYYQDLSDSLMALGTTPLAVVTLQSWEVKLEYAGSASVVSFVLPCPQLKNGNGSSRNFVIAGTPDLIVVNGQGGGSSCGFVSGGFSYRQTANGPDIMHQMAPKIIYNFPDADQKFNVANTAVEGSILAPKAEITGSSGDIWGQVVALKYKSDVVQHHWPFTGCLPG